MLVVSYLFYAAWNPPFVVLLWISTLADWYLARILVTRPTRVGKAFVLAASLAINLGLLGYFKYGTFAIETTATLIQYLGIDWTPVRYSIILPVGISFYTFQTLSYTLDCYRGTARPWHSFLDYALYVTFFPQLVAGPIVRARDFLPQCSEPRRADREQMRWGIILFIVGLFNKVVVADVFLSGAVESVFDSAMLPDMGSAWVGTLAFAGQIFCDFSGYSSCAVGCALCLGFELPANFRFPYAARGFSDFWRRWHITLSQWLRDYLYIGLGGNRRGGGRTVVNLMITMALGGLWHGAAWRFVAWGSLHGLYLAAEHLIARTRLAKITLWSTGPGKVLQALITFCFVCVAWVLFRAADLSTAVTIISSMLGLNRSGGQMLSSQGTFFVVGLVTAVMLVIHHFMADRSFKQVVAALPRWIVVPVLTAMVYAIVCSLNGEDRAFIYFQF